MQRRSKQVNPPQKDVPMSIESPPAQSSQDTVRRLEPLLKHEFTSMQLWMQGQFIDQTRRISELFEASHYGSNDNRALLGERSDLSAEKAPMPNQTLEAQTFRMQGNHMSWLTVEGAKYAKPAQTSKSVGLHEHHSVRDAFKGFLLKSKSTVGDSPRNSAPATSENGTPVRHSSMKHDWETKMERHIIRMGDTVSKKAHTQPPHTCLWRVVQGNAFGVVVAIVIAANAVMIGVDVEDGMQQTLQDGSWERSDLYNQMNQFFTAFFIVELFLRIITERISFIFGDEWCWNLFDSILVILSIVDIAADLMEGYAFSQHGDTENTFLSSQGYLRLIKNLRMVRVLRVIRVLRFFRELRRMCMSIVSALVSLIWAVVFLYLIIYITAIFFMQAGIDALDDRSDITDNSTNSSYEFNLTEWEVSRDEWRFWYGSLGESVFTLTKAISGGDDWGSMTDPLRRESPYYVIAFMVFIIFVVIGVLNVLIGVFLGSAAEVLLTDRDWVTQAETIKEEKFVKNFHSLFAEMDQSRDGKLNWGEFSQALSTNQTKAFFVANGLELADAYLIFSLIAGEAQEINVTDFIHGCSKLQGTAKSVHIISLLHETEYIRRELKSLAAQVYSVCDSHSRLVMKDKNAVDNGYPARRAACW